jgi:hypothetical protein
MKQQINTRRENMKKERTRRRKRSDEDANFRIRKFLVLTSPYI